MAVMTIRNLDDSVHEKLRVRAALHGRSMEAEARAILAEAVESPVERTLVDMLLQMRELMAGEALELPPRDTSERNPFA